MRDPSLLLLVHYLELLADARPDKFDRAAVRWHCRLELESPVLTTAESELALAALGGLRAGDKDAAGSCAAATPRPTDDRERYGMRSRRRSSPEVL